MLFAQGLLLASGKAEIQTLEIRLWLLAAQPLSAQWFPHSFMSTRGHGDALALFTSFLKQNEELLN